MNTFLINLCMRMWIYDDADTRSCVDSFHLHDFVCIASSQDEY